jgi:AcrR family transcriptional regulator
MSSHETDAGNGLGRKMKSTPEAIIQAAWELFEQKGYQATTMSDIAEHAGISRRSLFNYFPHKEALLDPGRSEYMDNFSNLLWNRPKNEPLIDSLRAVVSQLPAGEFNHDFIPGPEILRARLSNDAIEYTRSFCAREIEDAVLVRLEGDKMASIKAGLVGALAAQVLTEVAHLMRDNPIGPDQALAKVLDSLGSLFEVEGFSS